MSEALALAALWCPPPRVSVYEALMAQDDRLAARGFPRISDWWREQLRRFFAVGVRSLVGRVGRRGGKTTTIVRVLVALARSGMHRVPPGDIGWVLVVAVKLDVAVKRLLTIKAILDALGVGYAPCPGVANAFLIEGTNIGFAALPASMKTSVGDTTIAVLFDEVARWRDDETGSNPATEVFRAIRPSMAGQPFAREFMMSSPFSTLDAHAKAMAEGDTEEQMCVSAPTWVARPNLPEAECRKLESDEETFQREYGAIPMRAGLSTFFDPDAIDACVTPGLDVRTMPGDVLTAGGDFAFQRNSSALAVVRRRGVQRAAVLLHELKPQGAALKPSATVADFAGKLAALGCSGLMCDGHYRETIIEHLLASQLGFLEAPLDVGETYVRFRVELHEQGRLMLPENPRLIRDLKDVQSKPTPSGRLAIILPNRKDGSHGDMVSALVLACWQRAGTVVQAALDLPVGWSQAELDEADRMARKRRGEREGEIYGEHRIYR